MSKIEAFWENATAKDVERVMAGEGVEARFWDDEHRGKVLGLLVGWSRSEPCWCCEHCKQTGGRSYFENCQVYREPSWWTKKPDPGPEHRLLGKLPDEEPQLGDSVFCTDSKRWLELEAGFDPGQLPTHWYRRRIEPVKPEPQHYILRAGDTANISNGLVITITAKGFEVTQ
jgi:hypothetical protein